MSNIAAIVQARMGSTRLPGKVAVEIEGKPMLAHLITRLKQADRIDRIIIATSNQREDDSVAEIAANSGVSCYRGSETDVFSRYLEAGEKYKADTIVRVTGDCPLIDPLTLDQLIQDYLVRGVDYLRLNVGEDGYPRGLDAEVFSYQTLARVEELLQNVVGPDLTSYREHVTLYIYRHPEQFKVGYHHPPDELKRNYRLCVDEAADLRLIKKLYSRFYQDGGIVDIKQVIQALDSDPELAGINLEVEQKKV